MPKQDEIPTTKPEEIEALIEKLKHSNLDQKDTQLLERLLRTLLSLCLFYRRRTSQYQN